MTDDHGIEDHRRTQDRWHVGKEIPIALILMLLVQSGGAIWWAATQSAKMDGLASMMADFRGTQYTQNDARRDIALMTMHDTDLERRMGAIETAMRTGRAQ